MSSSTLVMTKQHVLLLAQRAALRSSISLMAREMAAGGEPRQWMAHRAVIEEMIAECSAHIDSLAAR